MIEMSSTEAATVARFEAAEPAPESAVERVARAISESDNLAWDDEPSLLHDEYRDNARAALAVMAGPDDTTRAVLALADELHVDPLLRRHDLASYVTAKVRAALRGESR